MGGGSIDAVRDVESKARINGVAVLVQMEKFDFLFGVVLGELILLYSDNLSQALQKKTTSAAEDQQVPDSTGKKVQPEPDTEANTLLDFEAAFQEAGNKEYNIDSAFEVKFDSKPKSQPPPTAATNDPFTTSNSSAAPSEKEPSGPWIAF